MDKFSAGHVAKAVEAMLSTGNIVSSSGLDMQQVTDEIYYLGFLFLTGWRFTLFAKYFVGNAI